MTNLLKTGSDWLEEMRSAHCSSLVTHRRGVLFATMKATWSRVSYETVDESGLSVGSQVVDFLVLAADFPSTTPLIGDIIDTGTERYEVMPVGEDVKGWRWSDPYCRTFRIHTRQIEPD